MKSVTTRRSFMPLTAIVLFSFLLALLAACGDSSATPAPAATTSAATTNGATSEATAASTTAPATTSTAGTTQAAATTPADTTAPATTAAASTTTTPSATTGASTNTGATAKGKNLDTAKGTVDSFDSSTGTLAVKESNGQTANFDTTKATIVGVSKLSLADFSKLSFTSKTVEFSAQPGSDGSYTPTALTILDQPAMVNTAKANAAKTKKAGATASTPAATAGTTDSSQVVLHNVSISGNILTGTTASGTSVTVNLSDTTTLNQRVDEKASDLAAGDKLTVDYRAQGKKATGPANAVAIVIEK